MSITHFDVSNFINLNVFLKLWKRFFDWFCDVMINLDNALGIHPDILKYRMERTSVLATNIANVDTPNYQAKDLSFDYVLNNAGRNEVSSTVMYRIPTQRTRDGNTVELQSEQTRFAQNAMEYQQSLQFLKQKISGLRTAIEGK